MLLRPFTLAVLVATSGTCGEAAQVAPEIRILHRGAEDRAIPPLVIREETRPYRAGEQCIVVDKTQFQVLRELLEQELAGHKSDTDLSRAGSFEFQLPGGKNISLNPEHSRPILFKAADAMSGKLRDELTRRSRAGT